MTRLALTAATAVLLATPTLAQPNEIIFNESLGTNGGTNNFRVEETSTGTRIYSISGQMVGGRITMTDPNEWIAEAAKLFTTGAMREDGALIAEVSIQRGRVTGLDPFDVRNPRPGRVLLSGRDVGGRYRFDFDTVSDADSFLAFFQSVLDAPDTSTLAIEEASGVAPLTLPEGLTRAEDFAERLDLVNAGLDVPNAGLMIFTPFETLVSVTTQPETDENGETVFPTVSLSFVEGFGFLLDLNGDGVITNSQERFRKPADLYRGLAELFDIEVLINGRVTGNNPFSTSSFTTVNGVDQRVNVGGRDVGGFIRFEAPAGTNLDGLADVLNELLFLSNGLLIE